MHAVLCCLINGLFACGTQGCALLEVYLEQPRYFALVQQYCPSGPGAPHPPCRYSIINSTPFLSSPLFMTDLTAVSDSRVVAVNIMYYLNMAAVHNCCKAPNMHGAMVHCIQCICASHCWSTQPKCILLQITFYSNPWCQTLALQYHSGHVHAAIGTTVMLCMHVLLRHM